jgi:AcrR family transcriptional regulator
MQEICAEAQISPGALYRYFDSKSDIIAAIAEHRHGEGDAEFERLLHEVGLFDALDTVFSRFLSKIETESLGPILADIFGEAARDSVLAQRLAQIGAHKMQRLAAAISAAQTAGEVDPKLDPREAAEVLGAAMEGMGLRFATTRARTAGELVEQFRTLAEHYLASRR